MSRMQLRNKDGPEGSLRNTWKGPQEAKTPVNQAQVTTANALAFSACILKMPELLQGDSLTNQTRGGGGVYTAGLRQVMDKHLSGDRRSENVRSS